MILFQTFIPFSMIAMQMLWYNVATRLFRDIFKLFSYYNQPIPRPYIQFDVLETQGNKATLHEVITQK